MFSGFAGMHHYQCMPVIWCADDDKINILIIQYGTIITGCFNLAGINIPFFRPGADNGHRFLEILHRYIPVINKGRIPPGAVF